MEAADFDFGAGEDWDDIAEALAADDSRRSREASRAASRDLPVPDIGSGGGEWRLASGDALNGTVTSVEGRTVHGTHSSACRECDGSGRPCPRCRGTGDHVRRVRLYTPHEVGIGQAFRRRREAARSSAAASALHATREADPAFFTAMERLDARARDPFVDQVMRTVERTGTLSQAQRDVVAAKCARLADLDDRRARSAHVGEVGKMVELEVTCRSARKGMEVPYNKLGWRNPSKEPVWSVSYRDRNGAELCEKQWGAEPRARPGEVVRLRGKVKSHASHDGIPQTWLTHVRVLELRHTSSIERAIDANPVGKDPARGEEPEADAQPTPGM